MAEEGTIKVVFNGCPQFAYPRVVRFINDHPWAIVPEKLEAIAEVLSHRVMNGPKPRAMDDDDVITIDAAAAPLYVRTGAVALVSVMGTISKRMNLFSDISGGASIEKLQAGLRAAVADPDVESILLQIDSPGGSVYGVQEFGDEIFAARSSKRIVAIADDLAASAAYWLASQAHELVVTPSGEVGSIGVVAMHVDYSEHLKTEGIKVTFVHAGENKVEGNPYEPLEDSAQKFLQSRVDDYYRTFVKAVARGRGTTAADVEKNFGQGRVYGSAQAKQVGMVDRIATLSETVERLQARSRPKRSTSAAVAEADIAEAQLKAS